MKILHAKPQTDLSGLHLIYKAGPAFEDVSEYGLSHLLEHLLCTPIKAMEQELQADGIDWNAYTSLDHVLFSFHGLADELHKHADRIIEALANYRVSDSDLNRERAIVSQEYQDFLANPSGVFWQSAITSVTRRPSPIAGINNVATVSVERLEALRGRLFGAPSHISYVSHHTLNREASSHLYAERLPAPDQVRETYPIKPEEKSLHIALITPRTHPDYDALSIALNCLGDGLTSPLVRRIREELNLSYSVFSGAIRTAEGTALGLIGGKCSTENADRFKQEAARLIADSSTWLTQERLDIMLKSLRISYRQSDQMPHSAGWTYNRTLRSRVDIDAMSLDRVRRAFLEAFREVTVLDDHTLAEQHRLSA